MPRRPSRSATKTVVPAPGEGIENEPPGPRGGLDAPFDERRWEGGEVCLGIRLGRNRPHAPRVSAEPVDGVRLSRFWRLSPAV